MSARPAPWRGWLTGRRHPRTDAWLAVVPLTLTTAEGPLWEPPAEAEGQRVGAYWVQLPGGWAMQLPVVGGALVQSAAPFQATVTRTEELVEWVVNFQGDFVLADWRLLDPLSTVPLTRPTDTLLTCLGLRFWPPCFLPLAPTDERTPHAFLALLATSPTLQWAGDRLSLRAPCRPRRDVRKRRDRRLSPLQLLDQLNPGRALEAQPLLGDATVPLTRAILGFCALQHQLGWPLSRRARHPWLQLLFVFTPAEWDQLLRRWHPLGQPPTVADSQALAQALGWPQVRSPDRLRRRVGWPGLDRWQGQERDAGPPGVPVVTWTWPVEGADGGHPHFRSAPLIANPAWLLCLAQWGVLDYAPARHLPVTPAPLHWWSPRYLQLLAEHMGCPEVALNPTMVNEAQGAVTGGQVPRAVAHWLQQLRADPQLSVRWDPDHPVEAAHEPHHYNLRDPASRQAWHRCLAAGQESWVLDHAEALQPYGDGARLLVWRRTRAASSHGCLLLHAAHALPFWAWAWPLPAPLCLNREWAEVVLAPGDGADMSVVGPMELQ